MVNLCEAKFTTGDFVIDKKYAASLRMKRTVFREATGTRKAIFITLLTTFPALQNQYYLSEVQNEVNMESLFKPAAKI